AGFGTALYGSGTTFFTLGLGDVLPHTALGAPARRARGRDRVRLPRAHHLVYAGARSGLLAARGQRGLARRTCRLAPERRRTAPAPCRRGLFRGPDAGAPGVGTLVG